ncbi:MAG: GNAT family N-acetyltransferase [Actinobacteria bacterium]|nr:GNAT family N-acetyltransferase [Actinomycetota bacterium]
MGEDQVLIERARTADFGEILRSYQHFWGDLELPRYLHHPMFIYEFGDTAFVARRSGGVIAGYLLGFVAPTGDGYIHFVAVRDDARGLGLGRRLYAAFTEAALARGAVALKAITNPGNEASIAFHRRLGFDAALVEDYGGAGRPRVVLRRALPPAPGPGRA